jgi:nitrogenase iron protein NifH
VPYILWVERIAVYGKGGIGKSVIASGLSTYHARQGRRVLHVGCDPKRDSCLRLLGHMAERTVVDAIGHEPGAVSPSQLLNEGRWGIQCIEAGGPEPGLGCGGRGVGLTVELLEEIELLRDELYDVALFDVLGDVVCGGFAAPLRRGFAHKVVIVLSEEPMALFAANNIAKAIVTYGENGVHLAGLVANLRSPQSDGELIHRFAQRLGTEVLTVVPRDPLVMEAERRCETVLDAAPDSPAALAIAELARRLDGRDCSSLVPPTPLGDDEFWEFLKK